LTETTQSLRNFEICSFHPAALVFVTNDVGRNHVWRSEHKLGATYSPSQKTNLSIQVCLEPLMRRRSRSMISSSGLCATSMLIFLDPEAGRGRVGNSGALPATGDHGADLLLDLNRRDYRPLSVIHEGRSIRAFELFEFF
jgi:hypothetical protein